MRQTLELAENPTLVYAIWRGSCEQPLGRELIVVSICGGCTDGVDKYIGDRG